MKILHLLGDLRLPQNPDTERASGVVRAALEIARAQARKGQQTQVVAVGQESWQSKWQGVQLRQLRAMPWARLGRLDFSLHAPYVLLTQRQHFAVIQGHLYPYLRFLRADKRIVHFHSDPFHQGANADLPHIAAHCDAMVAVSDFIADRIKQGLPSARVYRVYNGVDHSRFEAQAMGQKRLEQRRAWGLSEDQTLFLYAGAVVPEKGVIHLARAFAQLASTLCTVNLAIAGGSALWHQNHGANKGAEYEEQVRRVLEPLGSRVRLLGLVSAGQMPSIYAAADALVVPSVWNEPFPLVALEALASGLPVIASRVGGLPEQVGPNNGLLVEPGDEAGLQAALRMLATQPQARKTLGQNGRQGVAPMTWDRAAIELDEVYGK
jgi:glycosyltransferase involved in cell wall biosynthesis